MAMASRGLFLLAALTVISQTASQESNDGWGPWSAPSTCSRTCGVGVTFQTRQCFLSTPAGIPQCTGSSKIYRTCNKQPCAEGTDFRKDQCQKYNKVTFEGKLYTWVPYYGGENPCELNCLAVGEKFYYRHAPKVVDGTACGLNTPDICVDGACQMIGCDGELGSSMLWDKCHVCGGDGSSCKTLEGVVYTDDMTVGYNDVVLIPAGATSISIIEEKASDSYLAIRDLSGKYLLNGDWHIDLPLPKVMAGATFMYERGSNPSAAPERVTAVGPIAHAIFFVVLRQPRNNTAIRYEYSIPNEVKQDQGSTYLWNAGEWQSCSATCGKGIMERQVVCKRSTNQEVVNPDLCDPHRKPEESRECEIRGCPASTTPTAYHSYYNRWYTGDWGFCSTTCGRGVQTRPVYCKQQQDEILQTIVDDSMCTSNKPPMVQACNQDVECPKWEVGEWSKCNKVCGEGEQKRSVFCRSPVPIPNAVSDIFPESRCDAEERPESKQTCSMGPCEGVDWVVSDWSGCSSSCEATTETRHVVCSSKSLKMFDEEMCDLIRKPASSRPCPQSDDCASAPRWHASQWSKCSAKCGKGYQFRNVLCAKQEGEDILTKVEEDNCNADQKMNSTQDCYGENCAGLWFQGPWGKCSEPCGGGQRKREVLCFSGSGVADSNDCSPNSRPDPTQDCNLEPCDEDNLLVVGGCKGTRHGCCPDGITAAEGPAYDGCPIKDPIPAGLCVETDYGCCPDGLTPAQGPFLAGCPSFTCKDTLYGCCKDGQTPAGGPNQEQCPVEYGCDATAFGCCDDGATPANGPNKEGCQVTEACRLSAYGCCPDGKTAAQGPANAGCDVMESSGEVCEETQYGCCADGVTAAVGPNEEGCNEVAGCSASRYGCCPDGVNIATGDNFAGCPGVVAEPSQSGCAYTIYGCCPDGEIAALGPNGEGCHGIVHVDCLTTTFGCCPDQETIALGPNYEGCSTGCEDTVYGCCQDGKTPSEGRNYEGCDEKIIVTRCEQTAHGCCPDRRTPAQGPNFAGCNITRFEPKCDVTTHGCCPDGKTVASGPNFEGCSEEGSYQLNCGETPYRCCPDQSTPAQGPNNAGCPAVESDSAACGLPSEAGPCRNFSVKWFYDAAVGGCNRFWYGGCDGNNNRFETQEECKTTCVSPPGIDVCTLPSETGGCANYVQKYYFDQAEKICRLFYYGGCDGNGNNFETIQECQKTCSHHVPTQAPTVSSTAAPTQAPTQPLTQPTPANRCKQQKDPGPCLAYLVRWYYNEENQRCEQFIYGGCQGNRNRFAKMEECQAACMGGEEEQSTPVPASGQTGDQEICSLPRASGSCEENIPSWYFDTKEQRCVQFVYGGCEGNENRFETKADCERMCSSEAVCLIEKDSGDCGAYQPMWYYDTLRRRCERFVYSGCGGNGNRFENQEDCERRCHGAEERPQQPQTPAPTNQPRTEIPTPAPVTGLAVCALPTETGPCRKSEARWTYDVAEGRCKEFVYGGCRGNGNNFRSREECEAQCPVEGICQLPYEVGPCRALKPRFFYDTSIGQCRQFRYGGCQGNANRFLTEKTCQNTCMRETEEDNRIDQDPSQPEGGESDQADVCQMDKDPGSCADYTALWYFERNSKACRQFWYGGCEGNGNRFNSRDECVSTCINRPTPGPGREQGIRTAQPPTRPPPTRPPTPVRRTTPIPQQPGDEEVVEFDICDLPVETGSCDEAQDGEFKWFFDYDTGKCRTFLYSGCEGNANRYDSVEECERICVYRTRRDICSMPKEVGPCQAFQTRWHFDDTVGRCVQFNYGGCGSNANNFHSEEDCRYTCGGPEPEETAVDDQCRQPRDPGPCRADLLRYFFDEETKECRPFIFGGCQGNTNNFETSEECYNQCDVPEDERRIQTAGDCFNPPDAGPCDIAQPRWFFDPSKGDCAAFYYGGCQGNGNNFHTYEDCLAMCSKVTLTCGVLQCDLQCTSGYARGQDGCPICSCEDPCVNVQCAEGERCEVENESAVCKPIPVTPGTDGVTPIADTDSNAFAPFSTTTTSNALDPKANDVDENAIEIDNSGPPKKVYPSVVDVALCPEANATDNCSDVINTCDLDPQCPEGHLCCFDGCALSCMTPIYVKASILPPEDNLVRKDPSGCANTVYGCCPDGITPANDYNFRGCPEEEPSIDTMGKTEFMVIPGGDVILPCKARGAPRPQVTWYKDNFPLVNLNENEQLSQLADGSLQIREVNEEMATSFTCRAYNGIGEPATQTYRVRLEEEVGFLETPSEITVQMGETAHMFCEMRGSPPPPRRWLRNEQEIQDTTRVFTRAQRELIIMQARPSDQGSYICQANGPDGNVITKTFNVVVLGPLTVRIETHNDTFGVGAEINLKCSASGDGDIRVQWTREDVDIVRNPRFVQTLEGDLMIRSSTEEDAGMYKCTATRGRQTVSASTLVRIEAGLLPESCEDKPWLANCQLIVEARLCKHPYFSNFCCRSCHEAGHLP